MKTKTNSAEQRPQQNNLWQARHRAALERKQVAFLIGKKSPEEISRYEHGRYLPNLETALKLEIIYRTPVNLLFQELFVQLRTEIEEIRYKRSPLLPGENWFPKAAEQLKQEEFCFYAELLKNHVPSNLELQTITRHIIALSKSVSEYKQGRNPFADEESNQN
jgi:transcriptional regulator with XRE-family HTH domain